MGVETGVGKKRAADEEGNSLTALNEMPRMEAKNCQSGPFFKLNIQTIGTRCACGSPG